MFKELLYHGRLSFRVLLQNSRLNSQQLRHSLAVLIQQHLALWYNHEDDVAAYEANIDGVYALLRSGKHVKVVEDRFGVFSGDIVSNLLLLGHARVGDLAKAYNFTVKDTNGFAEPNDTTWVPSPAPLSTSKAQRHAKEDGPTLDSLHRTLLKLLQARVLNVVHISHFRADADNRTEAEKELPPPDKWASRLKKEQLLEWEKRIEEKLQDWKYGTQVNMDEMGTLDRGKKRLREDSESNLNCKRQKLHNSRQEIGSCESQNERYLSDANYLDAEVVLRVNHDKLDVMIRNQRLAALAGDCIGSTTAKVYAELLQNLEHELLHCKSSLTSSEDVDGETDPSDIPQTTSYKLEVLLKEPIDFGGAIAQVDPSQIDLTMIDHRKKLRRKMADKVGVLNGATAEGDSNEEELEIEDSNDDSNVSGNESDLISLSASNPEGSLESHGMRGFSALRQHLLLLYEHPYSFVHHIPRTSSIPEKWGVDFRSLSSTLQHLTLTATLTSRYGSAATRLVNLLVAKGKTDEKTLLKMSLLQKQPFLLLLNDLQKAGLFQLQEVPRDNSRQAVRTIFLWEWNQERARSKVLEECYGAMGRLIWRLKVEKGKVRAVVEKAERSDVVGKEEEMLGKKEMMALRKWWGIEKRIWGEVGRLDDMVAVLRDF